MKRRPTLWFVAILCGAWTTLAVLAAPSWWADRGVVLSAAETNDFYVINLGQLKNMASNAYAVLQAELPNGAGAAVSNLVQAFSNDNNYAAANLGQLKAVAQPFYDRLIAVGMATNVPWTVTTNDDMDYGIVNIGQLKTVFGFNLGGDSDGDGMPDKWEMQHGLNPLSGLNGSLAGWWKLDEYSGTNAVNTALDQYHGGLAGFSDTNASGWRQTGILYGALQFNGTTDRVEVAQSPLIVTGGAFTVSAWARLHEGSTQGFPTIISDFRVLSGTNSVGYSLGFNSTSVYAKVDNTVVSVFRDNQSSAGRSMAMSQDTQPMALEDWWLGVSYFDTLAYHGRTTVRWAMANLDFMLWVDLERWIDGEWVQINQEHLYVDLFGGPNWAFEVFDPTAMVGEEYQLRIVAYDYALQPTYCGPFQQVVASLTYPGWVGSRFSWEEQGNPLVSGASADPDGDGWTNLQEFMYGTDPKQGDSMGPWVWVTMEYENGQMRLYCNGEMVGSASNATFTAAATNLLVVGDGQDPSQDENWMGLIDDVRVYRTALGSNGVAAIYDAWNDLDGDGLVNLLEYLLDTYPDDPDTDGDGMPDPWEVEYGLDPRDPADADGDPDSDGVSNLQEYLDGTSPLEGDAIAPTIQILVPTNGSWRVWVP